MTNYNSGILYNSKKNSYNSANFYIIEVTDYGSFQDILSNIIDTIVVTDNSFGNDSISAIAEYNLSDSGNSNDSIIMSISPLVNDLGIGNDNINSTANINVSVDTAIGQDLLSADIRPIVYDNGQGIESLALTVQPIVMNDLGTGNDTIAIVATVELEGDFGSGVDSIIEGKKYSADMYFVVDTEGILQPLGVMVLGDSRKDLLPPTRDMTEEIPGRHGEIDFGTEFKARPLELHVATIEGLSPLEKEELRRKCAMYLNPTTGTKKLVFLDDPDKEYNVKYSGKITPTNQPTWFDFTIPFKMCDPLIYDGNETVLVGSGTLNNTGTCETGVIIEISGPSTNPSITIGSDILAYTGTIPNGQKLIIDTDTMTAKLNGANALANYNGKFPKIKPGQTSVTSGSNVTIKLKSKWL